MFVFEKVKLSKAGAEDLRALLQLKKESWYGTHHVSILNFEDQQRWFDNLDHHPHAPKSLVLIAEDELGVKFGVVKLQLDWVNRVADLGWDIFEEYRGKGCCAPLSRAGCAFCFDLLNMNRISAEILETNYASLHCAAKVGFVEEGRKRQAVWRFDRYIDSIVVGVLKKDWDVFRIAPPPQPPKRIDR